MEYVFKYVYSKNVIIVRMNVWIKKRDFNSLTQVMNKKKRKLINRSLPPLTSFTHYYVQNFSIILLLLTAISSKNHKTSTKLVFQLEYNLNTKLKIFLRKSNPYKLRKQRFNQWECKKKINYLARANRARARAMRGTIEFSSGDSSLTRNC